MNIIRPLQISYNSQVLEQNNKFYYTASASLGVNLLTLEPLIDMNYLKDIFEAMGDNPIPDMGMPKPNGEYLVSGKFFSKNKKPVQAGEVRIELGDQKKSLYVFGQRKWKNSLPSDPETIVSMDIDFKNAFGGEGYEKNPDGTGYRSEYLPNVEDPRQLITSKSHRPYPASFAPINTMLPQKTKFNGTYGKDYMEKYFPGYPPDHDWRFFLCSSPDQWIKDFYRGNEKFKIFNMHPEIPLIEGSLPSLFPRCFINSKIDGDFKFQEIPLNLDTIWFFPEKLMALMIFRGVIEVEDDEAENIKDIILGYENSSIEKKSIDYYKKAFERRVNSNDDLLKNMNTADLIPEGHKTAMELLFESAMGNREESEFAKNIDAKSKELKDLADAKVEEAIKKAESGLKDIKLPGELSDNSPGGSAKKSIDKLPFDLKEEGLDIRSILDKSGMDNSKLKKKDPELEELNSNLEKFIPGITSGDLKKLDIKNFSFDKLDDLFEAVDKFSKNKEEEARDIAGEQLSKVKKSLKEEIEAIDREIQRTKKDSFGLKSIKELEESRSKIKDTFEALENLDLDKPEKSKLPRFNSQEIIQKIKASKTQIDPILMDAISHLEAMKAADFSHEQTSEMEKNILERINRAKKETEKALKESEESILKGEKDFKESYSMAAHFMDEGLSPHNKSIDEVKKDFIKSLKNGIKLNDSDWACIDLSYENLEGIDLSGSYLEQVDFTGANLTNADLSGAVLSRAVLKNTNLTGANLKDSNLGGVKAESAVFLNAKLNNAKLSKGDFTKSDFRNAELENIETIEIKIDKADFKGANMENLNFVEIEISGADFKGANMDKTAFLNCIIKDCSFESASMINTGFVDSGLINSCFNKSDLSNSCLVVLNPEKAKIKGLSFRESIMNQTNFQNLSLDYTDFSHSQINNSLFSGSDLSNSDLSFAMAKNAQFRKSKLINTKLDNINLAKGSLAKAHLANSSFRYANRFAGDFLRSNIANTDFSGANLDNTIIENWRPA